MRLKRQIQVQICVMLLVDLALVLWAFGGLR